MYVRKHTFAVYMYSTEYKNYCKKKKVEDVLVVAGVQQ